MNDTDLSKILSHGTIIRTKHPKSEWISSIVYKVSSNLIMIELTQDYIKSLILPGDRVKCKFSNSGTEFLLEGLIDRIDIEGPLKLLTISVTGINKFENIRSSHRYDTHMISKLTFGQITQLFGIVTNVSSAGISILCKSELPMDSVVHVEVFVDSGNILRFDGQIVRKLESENGFEFGIRFADLDEESLVLLNDILEELKAKDSSLVNRYLNNPST